LLATTSTTKEGLKMPTVKLSDAMATRSETIGIMHHHNMRLQDFKDLISILGKKDSYSVQELKDFLGY